MIKALFIFVFMFLTGCSTLGSFLHFNTASYDGTEYVKATHLLTTIQLSSTCSESFINDIHSQSLELYLYSNATPDNQDIASMEEDVNKVITELVNHSQPVNDVYCKDKLDILNRMVNSLQHTIGNKTR